MALHPANLLIYNVDVVTVNDDGGKFIESGQCNLSRSHELLANSSNCSSIHQAAYHKQTIAEGTCLMFV